MVSFHVSNFKWNFLTVSLPLSFNVQSADGFFIRADMRSSPSLSHRPLLCIRGLQSAMLAFSHGWQLFLGETAEKKNHENE